mmetsp:Transcript_34715/g.108042  ORF Transcript_34715/g.108042 Transcript_34715/m.108042 type:complete len:371 (-) Transcript_34715:8-1120(-)
MTCTTRTASKPFVTRPLRSRVQTGLVVFLSRLSNARMTRRSVSSCFARSFCWAWPASIDSTSQPSGRRCCERSRASASSNSSAQSSRPPSVSFTCKRAACSKPRSAPARAARMADWHKACSGESNHSGAATRQALQACGSSRASSTRRLSLRSSQGAWAAAQTLSASGSKLKAVRSSTSAVSEEWFMHTGMSSCSSNAVSRSVASHLLSPCKAVCAVMVACRRMRRFSVGKPIWPGEGSRALRRRSTPFRLSSLASVPCRPRASKRPAPTALRTSSTSSSSPASRVASRRARTDGPSSERRLATWDLTSQLARVACDSARSKALSSSTSASPPPLASGSKEVAWSSASVIWYLWNCRRSRSCRLDFVSSS